jgi:hypothetical protein
MQNEETKPRPDFCILPSTFFLSQMNPEICPVCGAEVPPNAKACPECGTDEKTGWAGEADADRLGLPEEDFDYEDFVKREFGGRKNPKPHGIHWFWWIVAILLVGAFVLGYLL